MAEYVLGHSDAEHRRLEFQAELVAPITRRLLVHAGIQEGMHVLDIGTGRGDVAFIAAELVSETGSVVGIDGRRLGQKPQDVTTDDGVEWLRGAPKDAGSAVSNETLTQAAAAARSRAAAIAAAAKVLRRLRGLLRHGGVLAFHEIDWTGHRSYPPVPIWGRWCTLVTEVIALGGAAIASGGTIPSIFAEAGLPAVDGDDDQRRRRRTVTTSFSAWRISYCASSSRARSATLDAAACRSWSGCRTGSKRSRASCEPACCGSQASGRSPGSTSKAATAG